MGKLLSSFILIGFLISPLILAAECLPASYKVEGKNIILPGTPNHKNSVIYLFKNINTQSIWIDHPNLNPGASAGWASYIRAGNWSALAVNKKNFVLSCATIGPGKLIYLDCARVLTICLPKAAPRLTGNFWLAEDKPHALFIKIINKRGVR